MGELVDLSLRQEYGVLLLPLQESQSVQDQQQPELVRFDLEETIREADHHPQEAVDLHEMELPPRDLGVDFPPGDLLISRQNVVMNGNVLPSITMEQWILPHLKRCFREKEKESLWCWVMIHENMAK